MKGDGCYVMEVPPTKRLLMSPSFLVLDPVGMEERTPI